MRRTLMYADVGLLLVVLENVRNHIVHMGMLVVHACKGDNALGHDVCRWVNFAVGIVEVERQSITPPS